MKNQTASVVTKKTEEEIKKGGIVYVKSALLEGKMIPREVHETCKEWGKTIVMLSRFSHDSFSPEELVASEEKAREIALQALKKGEQKISQRRTALEKGCYFFNQ